jgi:hypothetical protein
MKSVVMAVVVNSPYIWVVTALSVYTKLNWVRFQILMVVSMKRAVIFKDELM